MDKMIRVDNLENLLIRLELFRQSYDAIMREVSYEAVPAIPIPDNATNGDVIKAMFPKGKVRREVSCTHDKTVFSFPDGTYFGAECRFNTDWWNAPYKGGQEDGKA